MTPSQPPLETNREVARNALEQVCPTGNMALAATCYSEDFADHVGAVTFHGLEGVRRSTDLYRTLLDDLAFDVVEQIAEDDRVTSRYLVTGRHRGRPVRLSCITISRLENGRIVEDYYARLCATVGLHLPNKPAVAHRCLYRTRHRKASDEETPFRTFQDISPLLFGARRHCEYLCCRTLHGISILGWRRPVHKRRTSPPEPKRWGDLANFLLAGQIYIYCRAGRSWESWTPGQRAAALLPVVPAVYFGGIILVTIAVAVVVLPLGVLVLWGLGSIAGVVNEEIHEAEKREAIRQINRHLN